NPFRQHCRAPRNGRGDQFAPGNDEVGSSGSIDLRRSFSHIPEWPQHWCQCGGVLTMPLIIASQLIRGFSGWSMSFDVEKIDKSSRRVKKFFRKNPKRPGQNAIHNLRTSIRSLETTFTTVGFDSHAKVRRLLRDLRDTRKSAGKVRD